MTGGGVRNQPPGGRRGHGGLISLVVVLLLIVLLIVFWDWNWFRPLVQTRASAALGRPVTIGRLHVHLGRVTQVTIDDVAVQNPKDFPPAPPAPGAGQRQPEPATAAGLFATIPQLTIRIALWDYIVHQHLALPLIDLERPTVDARQLADGRANWATGSSNGQASKGGGGSLPDIGDLRIVDGRARVRLAKLHADMQMTVNTQAGSTQAGSTQAGSTQAGSTQAGSTQAGSTHRGDTAATAAGDQNDNQIVVTTAGTYAAQRITGRFVGGALLSLRNAATPYPVDLALANGATKVSLNGTIRDPLKFEGANLTLKLSGNDMSDLYALTGVPIPQTPPYRVSGNLDYAASKIRFRDFAGVVGSSDLSGTIAVDPRHGERPLVDADLHSRSVDLNDLAGFIGGTPGDKGTPGVSSAQKAQLQQAAANDRLLPTKPINIPKLRAADISLRYTGKHIQGRYMPFDDIVVGLDIVNGDIRLHPLNFAVGSGTLASTISLREQGRVLYTDANVDFRQIDLARIMQSTHTFTGAGTIGGGAVLKTTGNSLSAMLGNGNGSLRFNMAGGGNLSALLQDLSGLQLGDAVLSALGIPNKATIRCLRSDFTLTNGTLNTNALALDTTEAVTRGKGTVDFKDEKLDMAIQTKPVRFSIGTLHAPINIRGTLKKPAIGPDMATVAARGGAAAGLGLLFPPLALLPTVQLGVGPGTDCQRLGGT